MVKKRRWTNEEINIFKSVIGDRYPHGQLRHDIMQEVSNKLGRSLNSVKKKYNKAKIRQYCIDKIVSYYQNHTIYQTAEKYDISISYVEAIIRKNGGQKNNKNNYDSKKLIILLRHFYLVDNKHLSFVLNLKNDINNQASTLRGILGFGASFVLGLSYHDYYDLFGSYSKIYFRTNMRVGGKCRKLDVVPWMLLDENLIGELKEDILQLKYMQKFIYGLDSLCHIALMDILSGIRDERFYMENISSVEIKEIRKTIKRGKEAYKRIIDFRNKKLGGKPDHNRSAFTRFMK